MRTLYLATLSTRNFDFTALGLTEDEARDAIRIGWNRHNRQTGSELEWTHLAEDVNVTPMEVGHPYRDGSFLRGGDAQG